MMKSNSCYERPPVKNRPKKVSSAFDVDKRSTRFTVMNNFTRNDKKTGDVVDVLCQFKRERQEGFDMIETNYCCKRKPCDDDK
jgi:hypothetical protein